MFHKLIPLYFFLLNYSFSQTHFTIPQNVWRISLQQEMATGKWKGHDGKDGWTDYEYFYNGLNYTINQYWKRSLTTQSYHIEYGLTDRATLSFNIPYINNFEQTHTWLITGDGSRAALDSVMAFYFPKNKSNSGLGDVTIGMNVLFIGNPAWRGGKQKYSLYGGIDATLPFGERLEKYYPKEVDSNGVPDQFKLLPIGNGLTRWRGRVFGELYRKVWGRLININWSVSGATYSREIINPSYSFLWHTDTHIDSISATIGKDVLHEQGFEIAGAIQGQIEAIPQRLFVTTGVNWLLSGRDQYSSRSDPWDEWMVSRKNYDTKRTAVSQYIKVNLLNVDPFKQIGPLPFELEVGIRWFVPYLTYHTYGTTSTWVRISTYLQAW
ncbi:MAG: hypothetical protein OXT08_01200 [Candidatus Marinimicrobia bacterium]|nr:hypothetical protein [Candidatus Neomarinimicrobiota bacterium]